jgi:hypothetical protein
MIDPVAASAVAAAFLLSGLRLAGAQAESAVLRARAELVRAVAQLPAGTQINGPAGDGGSWEIRIPASSGREVRAGKGQGR